MPLQHHPPFSSLNFPIITPSKVFLLASESPTSFAEKSLVENEPFSYTKVSILLVNANNLLIYWMSFFLKLFP